MDRAGLEIFAEAERNERAWSEFAKLAKQKLTVHKIGYVSRPFKYRESGQHMSTWSEWEHATQMAFGYLKRAKWILPFRNFGRKLPARDPFWPLREGGRGERRKSVRSETIRGTLDSPFSARSVLDFTLVTLARISVRSSCNKLSFVCCSPSIAENAYLFFSFSWKCETVSAPNFTGGELWRTGSRNNL